MLLVIHLGSEIPQLIQVAWSHLQPLSDPMLLVVPATAEPKIAATVKMENFIVEEAEWLRELILYRPVLVPSL